LILSGSTLYGTAQYGGHLGYGTVFKVSTNGTGFTILYSFAGGNDGANPQGGLILSGNTLYGTATVGGSSDNGTVYKVSTNGTGFGTLHSFTAIDLTYFTNSDGAIPEGSLILSGSTLYGTANGGGSSNYGTVFAVNTGGTGFKNLHSFTGGSDGAKPYAGLILSGNTLYGTAYGGGSLGKGTAFAVNTNGTTFTTLHSFVGIGDGTRPFAGLIQSGNTLYGTAFSGGHSRNGTVFKLTPACPILASQYTESNFLISFLAFPGASYTSSRTPSCPEPTGSTSPTSSAITP
jgi:uncharacterized repeat protein (TIGR03803 family)